MAVIGPDKFVKLLNLCFALLSQKIKELSLPPVAKVPYV